MKFWELAAPSAKSFLKMPSRLSGPQELQADVVKVQDIQQIMNAGVMITPAIAVDGEVKSAGKVLSVDEIKKTVILPDSLRLLVMYI